GRGFSFRRRPGARRYLFQRQRSDVRLSPEGGSTRARRLVPLRRSQCSLWPRIPEPNQRLSRQPSPAWRRLRAHRRDAIGRWPPRDSSRWLSQLRGSVCELLLETLRRWTRSGRSRGSTGAAAPVSPLRVLAPSPRGETVRGVRHLVDELRRLR